MNIRIIFFLVAGTIILSSCRKDKNIPTDPSNLYLEANYTFFTAAASLQTPRINDVDDVLHIQLNKTLDDVSLTPPDEIDPLKKDDLKRIKTVEKFADGQVISDICVWEKYAFVSYYDPNSYKGTVDVFSIEKLPGIVRMARFSFPKVKIHAVSYVLGRLLLAGSQEDAPAFVETIVYNPSLSLNESVVEHIIKLPATNPRGIIATEQNVYVLADDIDDGSGVYVFSDLEKMTLKPFVSFDNPLSITPVYGSNNIYVLLNNSIIQLASSGSKGKEHLLTTEGQSTNNMGIIAKDRLCVRADNNVQVFGANDQSSKNQIFNWNETTSVNPAAHPNHKNISIMKDWLMILGNEGADIKLCGLRNNRDYINEIFNLDGMNASLSFLASNDNVAFVVDQNSAIQILWRASKGFPEIPIYELNMSEESDILKSTLTEGGNNLTRYSNLQNCPASVKIKASTKVYVSVTLQEGMFTSTLGYYLLRNSSYPETVADLNKVVVFPNTQTAKSIGNTVVLCDANGQEVTFEAGQEIGFFLIPKGWISTLNNGYGGVDLSISTMYTHVKYNKENFQQHILYRLENHHPVFLGFEDMWKNAGGDMDMNDIVIAVSDNMDKTAITKFDMTDIRIPVGH